MGCHSKSGFLCGMLLGAAVGAMGAGMLCMPHKKGKKMIGRALKAAGELADNICDALAQF